MHFHRSLAALVLLATVMPSVARAQGSDGDKATARQLTVDGLGALAKKDYAGAVSLFTRADALYHAPMITLGLARAEVGLGKLASAQELYNRIIHEPLPPNAPTVAVKAVDDARSDLDALEPRVPSVVINVKGADAPKVTLDGVEVPSAALGLKRPADPGKHVVKASAAGFATSEATVILAEGKTESVTLELNPGGVALVPVVPPVVPPPPPIVRKPEPDGGSAKSSTQKMLGFVALGVGGAGLVVGAVTGGLALSKYGEITKSCPEGHCDPTLKPTLQSTADTYYTLGTVSTIGFIAGGALAATGVILILTAPKAKPNQPAITPVLGLGFIGAEGSF